MTGYFWHIFVFSILFIFLALMIYRILSIIRMPTHLRWELAPIPLAKEKKKPNNSQLEKWQKQRHKSLVAVISYMAQEMFFQKTVRKNNQGLWPFTLSMHIGIYLVILSVLLHIVNALFIITSVNGFTIDIFKSITAIIALTGYILGGFGAISLIFKRFIDTNFRAYSSFTVYFRLVFLAAIFISGIFTWFYSPDFASESSMFTRNLFTLDSGISLTTSLMVHVIILLLFLLYLPLTDMTHFITKYFTYHAVRWNDEPLNLKMEAKLIRLQNQTSKWSAPHVPSNKTWAEITTEKSKHEKTT